jgi:hypothetical protein
MKDFIPFTQQPYLCVAACLQMVLYRRGISLIEQELIANELGLIVPEEDLKYFTHARAGERPSSGYGTQIQDDRYSMQKLFDKRGWDLRFTRYSDINFVEELREKLTVLQANDDADVMICFDYGTLWDVKSSGGHVCVFEKLEGDTVHLIDPERDVPKRRQVSMGKLFKAIDYHGARNASGVWVIESKEDTNI